LLLGSRHGRLSSTLALVCSFDQVRKRAPCRYVAREYGLRVLLAHELNPHDRLPVLTTPGIVKIVSVGKTPAPVEEGEISALQRVESSGLPTIPWPYIEVGDVARIGDGPLKGLTGAVTRIKSEMKLILSVSLLQRSVAVEIDRDWIVDVETPPSATNEPASLASIARLIQPCGP
jgi:hypothetical protein